MANAASVVQTELFSDLDQEAMIAKFVKEVFKEGVGKNIPSARKTTMEQYLKNSLRVFSKAFNKDNVQDGFRAVSLCCALLHMRASFVVLQCGWYYPHNSRKIMAKWPGWIKLEPSDGDDTLEAVVELAHNIPIHGRIDDKIISQRLAFLPAPSIANVAELGLYRDRTVVLNAPGFNDARDAAAPTRAAKRQKEADAKAQEEAATFIEYKDRGHGRFNSKQICAQLALRGIKFKASEKVGTLDTMWQEHDAVASNIEKLRTQSKRSAASPATPSTSKRRRRSVQEFDDDDVARDLVFRQNQYELFREDNDRRDEEFLAAQERLLATGGSGYTPFVPTLLIPSNRRTSPSNAANRSRALSPADQRQ